MFFKKSGSQVFGVELSKAEKKALDREIRNQLAEYTRKNANEVDAMFLWYLHQEFGFGPERLKRVHHGFMPLIEELCRRYEMNDEGDDIWLCTKLLKDYGIDIEEWNKETR